MRRFSQFLVVSSVAWLAIASAPAWAQTDFGSVLIGAGAQSTVTLTIPDAATLGSIFVVTQGASGLDFTNAGAGTCAAGTGYAAGQTCTVEVAFKPVYAGERYGEALLKDGSGNVVATAFLQGNGVGPQIGYGPGAVVAIDPAVNGTSLFQPSGVAVDGVGNLFIADDAHDRVVEVPAGGGAATAMDPVVNGSGLRVPRGVAVDGAGDLFISDLDSNRIMEVPAGGGVVTVTDPTVNGAGLHYPCGLLIDGAGNLFIADVDNARIVEEPAGGGAAIATDPAVNGAGLSYPVNLALDSAGDLFISDLFSNRVVEVPAGGGAPIAIDPTVNGESLNQPYGVAVDAAGDLFIADSGNNRMVEVPAGGGAATATDPTVNGKGLNDPIGIALDGAGDLFISDYNNNRVVEVQRSQPPTLSFAGTAVGTVSSDSPQTVQVQNIGNAALTFPVPVAGSNPGISANFMLDSSGASDCPLVASGSSGPGILAAGASCLLPISFEPASDGSISGALTLIDNNLNAAAPGYATQSVSLLGDSPVASLSATSLSFGIQTVGSTSASQQLTLTNTGGAPMVITSIGVTGANASSFEFPDSCGSTLAARANCTIQGQFAPTASGAMAAAVAVTDNAGGSPQTVALTGTGVYPATVTVTPSASSITTVQPLTVTVGVSGGSGYPIPTGSVTLTIGSYVSTPAALLNGGATIGISAGSLAVGTDGIMASYTPDSSSSSTYSGASGSGSIIVTGATTPATTTGLVSAITDSSATLAGAVDPNGADTHYWFLYGASSSLSGASQTASLDLGSGTAVDPVNANITGLSASTTYYYRIVAQNSLGSTGGAIDSFTTDGIPYFSIVGAPVSVTPGAATGNTSTITIIPWNGFTGSVALSCQVTTTLASYTDLPTCSLQPASFTITGSASLQSVLTINTTAAVALNQPSMLPWSPEAGAVLAGILLFIFPRRRRSWRTMLGLLLLSIAAAGAGCTTATGNGSGGGGTQSSPGTTAGTYTVAVSGNSAGMITTASISLTVQ